MYKITKHICFYFLEERVTYINRIIKETDSYDHTTDIFVHTNNIHVNRETFDDYSNGSLTVVHHDLSTCHPFMLTWKYRELMKHQRDEYDIFMYIEDDILVPRSAIKYWLDYKNKLNDYNVGFVRIEYGDDGNEYITDLPGKQLDTFVKIQDEVYCVNNINPYCAFWIYDKNDFDTFIKTNFYDKPNLPMYGLREQSAIGMIPQCVGRYKDTVIPVVRGKLIDECKVYHLPNNYVVNNSTSFATIKFDDALKNISDM